MINSLAEMNIPIQKVMKSSTIRLKVTGMRRFRFGLWLLAKHARVTRWICGGKWTVEY